jgi:hypothetical protein
MHFKLKYFKYKTKYLNLIKSVVLQIGGTLPPEMILKIIEYMTDEQKIELMLSTDFGTYKPELKEVDWNRVPKYSVPTILDITDKPWRLIDKFRIRQLVIHNLDELNRLNAEFTQDQIEYINSITFSDEFNEDLGNSLDKLINLGELVFKNDNYDFPFNNLFNNLKKLKKLYLPSMFDKPLGNSLDVLNNLETLEFGYLFNMPLGNSLDKLINLKSLKFGDNFSSPLEHSLDKLVKLEFLNLGESFSEELNNSLDKLTNLKKLVLSNSMPSVNNSLDNLINLEIIIFGYYNNHPLEHSLRKLKNLKELYLGAWFNQELGDSLDGLNELTKINLGSTFSHTLEPLIRLQKLKEIKLPDEYSLEIPEILKDKITRQNV